MLDEDGFETLEEFEEIKSELERVILSGIAGHERSQQRLIGPSSLGTPCKRELAFKLMSPEPGESPTTQWRQTVGTAVHEKLERIFNASESGALTETRVNVGEVYLPGKGMVEISGTADLFYKETVVDFKVPGITSLRNKRKNGPGQQYRLQSHLYGRGFIRAGYDVKRVAILALPNSGEWRDRWWWWEPYREDLAIKALERAIKIGKAIDEFGLEAVIEALEPVDNYCHRCPFGLPGSGMPQCETAIEAPVRKPGHTSLKELIKP